MHLYLMDARRQQPACGDGQIRSRRPEPALGRRMAAEFISLYDDQGRHQASLLLRSDGAVKVLAGHMGGGGSNFSGGAPVSVAADGHFALPTTPLPTPETSRGGRFSDPQA